LSPRKILLLTTVVVLLFGFILLFERKMPTTSERRDRGDLVWDVAEDKVDDIELAHGGVTVELKKDGTAWKLVKPEVYPADSGAVSDALAQLAKLKRSSAETAEPRPDVYGLQPPAARAVLSSRSDGNGKTRVTHAVDFGVEIPGTDTTAARLTPGGPIFFVPTTAAAAARKSPDDFKSKDVFPIGLDPARLDIDRGRGRIAFNRRNGVWWLTQPFSDLANADEVQRMIGDLTGLRVLEFVASADRQNLAALGLSPPLYRVTLADAKSSPAGVDFGSTRTDGNSVYARREGQVFTVSSATVEELSKEAVAFREPRLVRFDRAAATEVTGTFPHETLVLTRGAAGWTAGGRPLLASSADDALTAILDLKSRAFLEDREAAGLRSGQALAQVTVKVSSGDPWTIALYPRRGDTDAVVSGRPGAFLLSGDAVASLQAAFHKAVAGVAPTPAPTKPKPASTAMPGR
jgi:hypothetical protein